MAQKVQEIKGSLEKALRNNNKPWTPLLAQIEMKTGVDRLYVFLGFVGFIAIWLVFGYAAQLVSNFVGFLYPAYTSIHAIESRSKEDDTKWLTYWVVFAFFSIVEYFADLIVGWFPLYWLVKCIFFVWLMLPGGYNGSIVLYNRAIRPYFLKHHTVIDETLNNIKQNGNLKNGYEGCQLQRGPLLWPASHKRTVS